MFQASTNAWISSLFADVDMARSLRVGRCGSCQMDAPVPSKVREPSMRAQLPRDMQGQPLTDADLVAAAGAGRADALGVLWQPHRVALYAAAMAVLRDRDAAMDAVQETFVIALTRLDDIRDPAAVGGWLHRVVRNCGLAVIGGYGSSHSSLNVVRGQRVVSVDADHADTDPCPCWSRRRGSSR